MHFDTGEWGGVHVIIAYLVSCLWLGMKRGEQDGWGAVGNGGRVKFLPLVWRINRGWRRRKDKNQLGFYINPITGVWSKQDDPGQNESTDNDEALLDKVPNQRIVPFVEDHRNVLILTPVKPLFVTAMSRKPKTRPSARSE